MFIIKNWRGSHLRMLPDNHSSQDIYLVSFPKSGNTWLRFLIANAIKVEYGLKREVNFFSIHDIVPDVGTSKKIPFQGPFGRLDLPRVIKSHSKYNPYYYRVILLVRNPSDVMVSLYHYSQNHHSIPTEWSIADFIKSKHGIRKWAQHTESWLGRPKVGSIVRIFSYEDLKQDTANQLSKMLSLIGISHSQESVLKAVELSSKDSMRASEIEHMSTQLIKHQKTPFVRNAEVGFGKELSDEEKTIVEKETKSLMHLLKA